MVRRIGERSMATDEWDRLFWRAFLRAKGRARGAAVDTACPAIARNYRSF